MKFIWNGHPYGKPTHDYCVGFIHGSLIDACWYAIQANKRRKPTVAEMEDVLELLKKRMPEIEDGLTIFEEEVGNSNKMSLDYDNDLEE